MRPGFRLRKVHLVWLGDPHKNSGGSIPNSKKGNLPPPGVGNKVKEGSKMELGPEDKSVQVPAHGVEYYNDLSQVISRCVLRIKTPDLQCDGISSTQNKSPAPCPLETKQKFTLHTRSFFPVNLPFCDVQVNLSWPILHPPDFFCT